MTDTIKSETITKPETKKFFFMIAGMLYYKAADNKTNTVTVNSILNSSNHSLSVTFTAADIVRMKATLAKQAHIVYGIDGITNIVITNIFPLGLMTEKEFNNLDEIENEINNKQQ